MKICEQCGAEFNGLRKTQRYCSSKCFGPNLNREKLKAIMQTPEYKLKLSVSKTGEKNGMWNAIPHNKQFPTKKWWEEKAHKELREIVFKRDKYSCVECGVKKNLQLDHIVPYRMIGQHTLENLQTLCISCHGRKSVNDLKNYPELTRSVVI